MESCSFNTGCNYRSPSNISIDSNGGVRTYSKVLGSPLATSSPLGGTSIIVVHNKSVCDKAVITPDYPDLDKSKRRFPSTRALKDKCLDLETLNKTIVCLIK